MQAASSAKRVSSIPLSTISKATPAVASRPFRRGEAEASINEIGIMIADWQKGTLFSGQDAFKRLCEKI